MVDERKAGQMLRGGGADPTFAPPGRKQRLFAPKPRHPVLRRSRRAPRLTWRQLLIWAASHHPAISRGPKRPIGIRSQRGICCWCHGQWAVITVVVLRLLWSRMGGVGQCSPMQVFAAGGIGEPVGQLPSYGQQLRRIDATAIRFALPARHLPGAPGEAGAPVLRPLRAGSTCR
jgi:hypothetical protein